MKTFLTEKHNIPEGATHYQDEESGIKVFAFFKKSDGFSYYFAPGYENKWMKLDDPSAMLRECVKPIPQTKEVEWKNGDECRYANDIDHSYTYVGEHPHGDGHYVFSEEKGITYIANGYLLEPETPEAKKEREELEAAYDLYCELNANHNCVEFDRFKKNCKNWIRVVRKTEYRVEK